MIPDNAMRVIEFAKEDIDSCNTAHFIELFKGISQTPWKAKELRSRVVLGFSAYNDDPRPNYGIPAIRKFIQSIDASLPFLPYFLISEPALGHILFYMQCLIDVDTTNSKYTFSSHDLVPLMRKKMIEINRFCEKIADNANSVFGPMILNLPPEMLVGYYPEYAIKALNSMQALFQSMLEIKRGQRQVVRPPDMKDEYVLAYEDAMFVQAEKLSGLLRSNYSSQEDFIVAILQKISERSKI